MGSPWIEADSFVRLVNGRWTLRAFAQLAHDDCRYQDLLSALDGVSRKVLVDTLRRAERDGFVCRQLDPRSTESRTLYVLTDLGRSLAPALEAIAAWMADHGSVVEEERRHWDDRGNGDQKG